MLLASFLGWCWDMSEPPYAARDGGASGAFDAHVHRAHFSFWRFIVAL
jgi:hypothetical protein